MTTRTLMRVADVAAYIDDGVYFIAGADLTKIGRSSQIDKRMRDLQAMSPVPLELVMTISSDRFPSLVVETWLHEAFAEWRKHGEWFSLPPHWEEIVAATLDEIGETLS